MFPKNRSVELRCLSADETIQGTGAQTERTAVHQIPRQIVNSMVSKINLITNGHKRTAVLARAAGLSCLVIWNEEEKSCSDDDLIHLLDTRMQNPRNTTLSNHCIELATRPRADSKFRRILSGPL